jgi:cytochrome P450
MSTLGELATEYGAASAHDVFARLRVERPVGRVSLPNGRELWLVTRYDDVRTALNDPRLSTRVGGPLIEDPLPPDIRADMNTHLLRLDGADHTRLRRLVSPAFTARRIEKLRPEIEATTDRLLSAMASLDEPDVIRDLAFPLPLEVIHSLLGIPAADQDRMRAWSSAYLNVLGAQAVPVEVITEFVLYLRELVELKRREPDDKVLSAMIAAQDQDDRLDQHELTSMCVLLVVAGYETAMNMIGNGVHLLLSDPRLADRLRADPSAIPAAVEEFLRLEGPTPASSFRIATADLEIGGRTIRAGELVSLSIQSANRDDAVFPDPGELHADRAPNPHLAFGHGIHFCLGAPLARLEGEIVFRQLLERFPRMAFRDPDAGPKWWPGFAVRGLSQLPIVLGPPVLP